MNRIVCSRHCWMWGLGLLLLLPADAMADFITSRANSRPLPSSVETGATGANLQPGDTIPANLGAFDIVINPSVALAANAPALAAFNRAAEQWEALIADPITVNIDADFSALPAGVLGSTSSVILFGAYNAAVRNPMVADAADEADDAVAAFLPTAVQFTAFLPSGFAFDGNMQATKANLKAMGIAGLDGMFGASDGDIAFSTLFTFDFDHSNGVDPLSFDFETIAAHEIGHLLGFISDVDYVDFVLPSTATDVRPTPLDLFRFDDAAANDPTDFPTFTTEPRSLVPGNVEHFDQITPIGGGAEVLTSSGVDFGDGRQASHWKDNLGLGLMDPTLGFQEVVQISGSDMRALDLIGYEITTIPEARAWLCGTVVSCLGTLGVVVRRKWTARLV